MDVAGRQSERTALAWRRTSLATLANSLLLAQPSPALAALCAVLAATTYAIGLVRRRALRADPICTATVPVTHIMAVGGGLALLALLAIGTVLAT